MKLKTNDVVKIAWLPGRNGRPMRKIAEIVGFIRAFNSQNTRVWVQRFGLDGRLVMGQGWISLLCLELVHDSAWVNALAELHREQERIKQEEARLGITWSEEVKAMADKYAISCHNAAELIAIAAGMGL